jgi:hypothetical protein
MRFSAEPDRLQTTPTAAINSCGEVVPQLLRRNATRRRWSTIEQIDRLAGHLSGVTNTD